MKIGVLLPNWIGDVVMATPTLRALRRFYRDAHIVGVMRPYVSQVLAGTDWLDETLTYDRRSRDPNLRGTSIARQLRRQNLDMFITLPNSLSAGWLAWRSGARQRVGYVRNGRGPLLNRKLTPPRDGWQWKPVSAVDYYLDLAYAVGCPPESKIPELATLAADERGADRVWENLGLDDWTPVVVMNTGGAYGAAKDWPRAYFVELAGRIVRDFNASVLVICGPAEKATAAAIECEADHPRIRSMADQDTSLGVAKACIRRSQLMITTDSGPRHFAAAFDVPAVSLFGPIDPRWSTNYNPRETTLLHQVPCGPCGERVCPLVHHRCMRDLTVDRVYAAAHHHLAALDRAAA